ncbi:hypothetical protein EK904_000166 [Melospiza melodia maxima]|nr:hypothetical protein EK904_000166 [Melospiza melodia maxima]
MIMTVLYVKLVVLGVKETTTGSTMLIREKLVPDCLVTIGGFNLSIDATNTKGTSICCCTEYDHRKNPGKY